MRHPPPLKAHDPVAVVAPAGPVEPEALRTGIKKLSERFRPSWREDCLLKEGYLAGADERRLEELQRALDGPDTRAVLAARGGYGTGRLLDRLSFDTFMKRPKWIVGSSDLTALQMHIYAHYRISTLHGPMVFRFENTREEDLEALYQLLQGKPWRPPGGLGPLLPGEAEGPLIGGNLTVLASLCGALPQGATDGAILFLEDVGEPTYRLDRCLNQLRRAGVLDGVKGIVLGEFTNCPPASDGYGPEEMLKDNLRPLGIPVATGYPAAHGARNYPFVHGGEVRLVVEERGAALAARGAG